MRAYNVDEGLEQLALADALQVNVLYLAGDVAEASPAAAQLLRGRLEKDSIGIGDVIQARDVDRAESWPDGQDRQEDEALPV